MIGLFKIKNNKKKKKKERERERRENMSILSLIIYKKNHVRSCRHK